MKFTYVATCQNYGNQKRSGDRRATDILNLMVKYVPYLIKPIAFLKFDFCKDAIAQFIFSKKIRPLCCLYSNPSLRVAYMDEVEETENGKVQKVYYSVLVKAVDNLDQVHIEKNPVGLLYSG